MTRKPSAFFSWTTRCRFSARWRRCCGRADTTSTWSAPALEAVEAVVDQQPGSHRARSRDCRISRATEVCRRIRTHVEGADHRPVGARRRSGQGRRARSRRRRLRDQAVRRRGAAGAGSASRCGAWPRRRSPEVERVQVGDLTIDYDRRRVVRGDEEIRLTPKEFELLALLARNADRVLTHRAILKAIWGPNAVNQPEHLWVLIAQLRKKIEPDPSAAAIPDQRTVGRLPFLHRAAESIGVIVESPPSCQNPSRAADIITLTLTR